MEGLSISQIGNNDRGAVERIRKYCRPSLLQQSTKERSSLNSYENSVSNLSGTQWFQTLQKNPAFCAIGEKISQPIERPNIDVPKVTFNRTVFQSDEPTRSYSNERTDPIFAKHKILSKMKDRLNGKTGLKSRNVGSKKEHEKYCQKMYEKSGHRCRTNQMIAKNKISQNDGNLRAISGVQNILRGLKRSRNFIKTGSSNEDVSKKRRVMEGNIVRNKRLLKAMENVISTMDNNDQDRSFPSDSMEGISVETEKKDQEPAKVLSNVTTETTEILKPIFRKPEIEEYLDESMERAIKKYKTSLSFSMKLEQENSSSRSIHTKKNPVFCLPVQI